MRLQQDRINLALVSPMAEVYSETFIKAQKDLLPFNVYYYSGGNKPRVLEGQGSIADNGNLEKMAFYSIKMLTGNRKQWHDYKLARSFRSNRIDCVLAQYGQTGVAMLPVCKALKIPLIVHFHGQDASRHQVLETYKEEYREMFEYAARTIAVSRAMYQKLLGLGCPQDSLILNTYGPNDSFLEIEPRFENEHFIGIGRFTDKKAPYYTILAFSKVLETFPNARLTIGGDGELYFACTNLVKYLKIEHAVSLPGKITPSRFRELMTSATAFVQHSVVAGDGDSEGTPVAILEASGAGLPVISTKHAGIPDVILDGETGFLVDEHDVDGMARSMRKLLADRAMAKRMGKAGKERIRHEFSMSRYVDKLAEEISAAVAE
jgi:glycosyltransferase involved in cell wall biosynthesis